MFVKFSMERVPRTLTDHVIALTLTMFSVTLTSMSSSSPQNSWNHLDLRSVFALYPIRAMLTLFSLRQDVGYNYVNIDDCYSEKERDESGSIVASAYHLSKNVQFI